MSTLVHSRGEGIKNGQNLVHVVVECPPTGHPTYFGDFLISFRFRKSCDWLKYLSDLTTHWFFGRLLGLS